MFLLGQSGAGISTAARSLQDLGFFVVDNLPVHLVPAMVQDLESRKRLKYLGYGIGIHTYSHLETNTLEKVLLELSPHYRVEVMFLTADTEVLEQRFSVTRRPHPLISTSSSLKESIEKEKKLLEPLKKQATRAINTTHLNPTALSYWVRASYLSGVPQKKMLLLLSSFGFKYQMPLPADLVFDARFLKNPYFEPDLRDFSGTSKQVQTYIKSDERYQVFVAHIKDFLTTSLPFYLEEGRCYLRVSVGCTGGRHRSVAIIEELAEYFHKHPQEEVVVQVTHRDLEAESGANF